MADDCRGIGDQPARWPPVVGRTVHGPSRSFPSLEIVSAVMRSESFLGVESCDVQLEEQFLLQRAHFRNRRVSIRLSSTGAARTRQDLAFSPILLLLSHDQTRDKQVSTMSIDLDRPVVTPMGALGALPGNGPSTLRRAAHRSIRCSRLTKMAPSWSWKTPWRGLREVVPLSTDL